ncbi:MAG TPA: AMP-binding protein [bacterium]
MAEWFPKRTIGGLPREAAARFGGREALMFKGQRWSFAQFEADVQCAARALLRLGVQPGDKVSLWMPNRPEWLHLMFAICRVGAVLVPVNTRLRANEVAYIVKQSNSTTFITTDVSGPADYRPILRGLLPDLASARAPLSAFTDLPDLKRVIAVTDAPMAGAHHWATAVAEAGSLSDADVERRAAAVDPDATTMILYTSGTTGFPKGVMHGHAMVRNMTDHGTRAGITEADAILMYLPLFHIFGFTEGPLTSMLTGARQVLTDTFNPDECLDLVGREKITLVHGFDTHFKDLLEALERKPRDVSTLRTGLAAAGMASSTPIIRRTNQQLLKTLSCYGMSEISVGACLTPLDGTDEQRCEASGYPAPGYEIAIVDPATGQPCPTGTPGEVVIRGYMVMQGYYNKPEETAKTIDAQGWLHSGDMGYLRPDGHLCFMGRYKDMLKIGGENVDPMEVEGYLLGHPDIQQVAVVGLPDARLHEVAVAYVIPKSAGKLTPQGLIEYCKGKIASFKVPRHVVLVEELPMTSSGKIQKAKLRDAAKQQIKA